MTNCHAVTVDHAGSQSLHTPGRQESPLGYTKGGWVAMPLQLGPTK